MFNTLFEKISKKFCRHKVIMIHGKAEDGELTEPGGKPRKVKIGMVRTYCPDCDRTFKMTPMGVVFDPVKGINVDFQEKKLEAPPEVRKEVLKNA